jgi:hypothetical protein
MKLYKPTANWRETLTQEARVILKPEEGAPPGSYRKVQITIPPSPPIFAGIDQPVQKRYGQSGIGPNRDYELPNLPPGQCIEFALLPEQFLTASARPGLGFVSLIIEYIEED